MQMEGDDCQPWYLKIDPTWPEDMERRRVAHLDTFRQNNPNYQVCFNFGLWPHSDSRFHGFRDKRVGECDCSGQ